MPVRNDELVRVMSESEILQIVPTLPYRTSCALNWSGIEVHRYRLTPGDSKEHAFPHLTVFVPHSDAPNNLELTIGDATVRKPYGNDVISIMPPYLSHRSRRERPYELTAIFLDPSLTMDAALALTGTYNPEITPQVGIRDPLVRAIGTTLDAEIASSHPGPGIYAESLALALSSHILRKYVKPGFGERNSPGLNGRQLHLGLEFIRENLDKDLSLAEMAATVTMSKYHFAKSFKQAMGIAPHRYLVRLRIEKARKLLIQDSQSVDEIASSVGYFDRAHFAEQFRRYTGMSPTEYRRLRSARIG
jgi:AraC family transcriptional regulator